MERGSRAAVRAALGLSGIVVSLGLPALAPICSVSRLFLGITDRLADRTKVALTFDDGPHPDGTPRVLDFLSETRTEATFFLVGEQVLKRPRLAAEIALRGHEIGLHGYEHRTLVRLTGRELSEDLERAAYVIASATNRKPDLYRPPRGVFTYSGLAATRRLGLQPILWAADGRDWRRRATPNSICQRITGGLKGGEVILLHDADHYGSRGSWRNTLAALPLIVRELNSKELTAVALHADLPICTFLPLTAPGQ